MKVKVGHMEHFGFRLESKGINKRNHKSSTSVMSAIEESEY
jgi:hypothetical protein